MARTVRLKDLQTATAASIKAILGKPIKKPGVIAGFILADRTAAALGKTPLALAKEVAAGASKASGIRLKPAVQKLPGGGILCGYIQPRILPTG